MAVEYLHTFSPRMGTLNDGTKSEVYCSYQGDGTFYIIIADDENRHKGLGALPPQRAYLQLCTLRLKGYRFSNALLRHVRTKAAL